MVKDLNSIFIFNGLLFRINYDPVTVSSISKDTSPSNLFGSLIRSNKAKKKGNS